MNTELVCVATFTAKTEKSDALRKALSNLLEPTRREEGCLHYALHESLNNPNVFTMLERFKNKNAFDSHCNEPYMLHFKENILNELVDSTSISIELYKEIEK
ncbi:putative quinol monooxygenase [Rickettsiella endosymbiont of Rhagonycha lignosa]|uniref:putative quinol monooxygenase n=1 Tax=Rickettsiella endosymbiont of Rhagonycha lignosa TaxID=3077937 RepID=UPI00313D90C9